MRNRCLAVMSALAVVAGVGLIPVLVAGQTPAGSTRASVARGEPDLQGIWYAYENVPLQRPAQYAGKEFLTDAEMKAKYGKAWINRVAEGFSDPSGRQGRDRRAKEGTPEDVSGAYNALWTPGRDDLRPSRRTALIVDPPDGKIPPLTPEARKRIDAYNEFEQSLLQGTPSVGRVDRPGKPGPLWPQRFEAPPTYNLGRLWRNAQGPEDRGRTERCLPLMMPVFGGRNYQRIVQSPGYVALYYEPTGHTGANRVVPVGEARQVPLPQNIRQWKGDPRGRWDGRTLVVETTNFTNKTDYQGSRENLRLTERFTRLDATTIRYEVTIQDPTTFTRPWTVRADMGKLDDFKNALYEPQCHEGNYGLIGMLSGARAADKAFKEGRGPDPWSVREYYEEVPGVGGSATTDGID